MKKRILTILMACFLTLGLLPLSVSAAGELAFTDVAKTDWFYNDVKTAVDAGLVNGKSATTYCPADNLTYAEAVKLAACMNQKHSTGVVSLVNGDPWYQSYVDYAKMQGIITKDYEWKQPATRAGYMAIFAHALPDSALAAKNEVPDGSIPDVPMTHPPGRGDLQALPGGDPPGKRREVQLQSRVQHPPERSRGDPHPDDVRERAEELHDGDES